MDWVAIPTATISAAAAVGSWMAARHANRAARTLVTIERHRWHTELTPIIEASFQIGHGDRASVTLTFTGPSGLDRLDEMTVKIRNDRHDRTPGPGQADPDDIARQVWGPYRFVPGADGADADGRQVAPVSLPLGERRTFEIERTMPPSFWSGTQETWRAEVFGPLRLEITCRHRDHEPWTVLREVDVGRPRIRTM